MKRLTWVWLLSTLACLAASATFHATALVGPVVPAPLTAPGNLKAVGGNGSITLEWSAVEGATGYRVYRATEPGGQPATSIAKVSGNIFKNTGLASGTPYFYRVAAYNSVGTGPLSIEVGATLLSTPAGFAATAGNTQVALEWEAVPGASSYNVYRAISSIAEGAEPVAVATIAAFVDTGLTNGTKYYYRVRARNDNAISSFSTQVSARPQPPPPSNAPANVTAVAGNTQIALEWSAVEGATGYRIFRATDSNGQSATPVTSVTGTSYKNGGLTNGTPYFYKVAAFNPGGNGPLSTEVRATPMAAPSGLTATAGDKQVTLNWDVTPGAVSYSVYRDTAAIGETAMPIATGVGTRTFLDAGLTNGTKYYYAVRAHNDSGVSALSKQVYARPQPLPPATAPASFTAVPGNAQVVLSWSVVENATGYRIFRSTTPNDSGAVVVTSLEGTTYRNKPLSNGTTYYYRVAAFNPGGTGPHSNEVAATPLSAPETPTGVTAISGNAQVTLGWTLSSGATSYNVYRGTEPNRQSSTPVAAGIAGPTFPDESATNGPTYYYKVTALNAGGESPRSAEVSASPEAPAPTPDPETISAFRLLQQTTWGARPGEVDRVKAMGKNAFLAEQLSAPVSVYPDTLFEMPLEATQEHFMQLALTGPDQLRQRVAWALHKIWVVSGVEVESPSAIVTYKRILLNNAFGNYRDLMLQITLNPAMGRYLNMLNNRSQAVTNALPNENYPRELMQLFVTGIPRLNPDGTPLLDDQGRQIPVYTEEDVRELARIFTGWTFGDGNPSTIPTRAGRENYRVPMEAVENYHDRNPKFFLGATFPAGLSSRQDLDQALDVLFNHPNVGPFISRQLIVQLVTSNPSPGYVMDVAAVFNNNGSGVRGDLAAVVRAILMHPEAGATSPASGRLMEPVMLVISPLRALNAAVTDHPFMSDKSEEMGQKVFYPPSVFSYFSPGFRVRGTPLGGPEFQILTAVTALVRTNYVGSLVSGQFGRDVTIDYSTFTGRAADPAALVDYCNLLFMGGQMSLDQRAEIIKAVRVSPASRLSERVRTALYLTLAAAQYQVVR